MSPEKLFHELLGLGSHWRVTELEYLKGKHGEVRIVIEDEDALFDSLRCCEDSGSVRRYDHGTKRTRYSRKSHRSAQRTTHGIAQ